MSRKQALIAEEHAHLSRLLLISWPIHGGLLPNLDHMIVRGKMIVHAKNQSHGLGCTWIGESLMSRKQALIADEHAHLSRLLLIS